MSGLKTCACGEPTYGDECSLCSSDKGLFQLPAPPAPVVPKAGSRWARRDAVSTHGYTVWGVTNTEHPHERHPAQVVYQGDNGSTWSLPLAEWPGNLQEQAK